MLLLCVWFRSVYFTVCSCFPLQLRYTVEEVSSIYLCSPYLPRPGGSCRPHPYRKRPTLSNVSNQSIQPNYNLRYQDSYSPEYPPLHRVAMKSYFHIDGWCFSTSGDLLNLRCSFGRLYDAFWSDAIWCLSSGFPGALV